MLRRDEGFGGETHMFFIVGLVTIVLSCLVLLIVALGVCELEC